MRTPIFASALLLLGAMLAGAQPAVPEPTYTVHREASAPVSLQAFGIDTWSKADKIEWGPAGYKTTFRALWTDTDLWLRFDIQDPSPWYTMTKRDDHIWEEEVVEIFIDLDGSHKNYAEYEINPANVLCDLRMESGIPDIKGHIEWDHEGLESAVQKRAAEGDGPGGWTAILRMPWKGFATLPAVTEGRVTAPPRPGDIWRFNLYRIERPRGPEDPRTDGIFAAWSPTGGRSFHNPAAFRPMIFVAR